MDKKEKPTGPQKTSLKLTIFDPEKPLYERRHLCTYLSELEEEAGKESQAPGEKEG